MTTDGLALVTTATPPAMLLLVTAVVVATTGRRTGTAVAVLAALAAAVWAASVRAGTGLEGELFGFAVVVVSVDPVSRAVGTVLALVGAAALCYGAGTGASRTSTALGTVYVGAALGVVFAGDWLTLVVWWELLALAATALVWTSPGTARVGFRYALYHQVGGILLVAAVLLARVETGSFLLGVGGPATVGGLPLLLGLLGVGVNVGFLGLHPWLPDTYPSVDVPTTVVLSAFTTKVGVYTLLRLVPDGSTVVVAVGAAMTLVGVTYAVLQTDLRRLLTYHIVSQVGYMVAAAGAAGAAGRAATVGHLANNVLYKTLLFMVAGVVVLATGRESLKRVGGLARPLPVTAGAFAVAALAITGVPGFAGFVSKGLVTGAVRGAGHEAAYWALQVGAVGTVVSFAKVAYYAFLRPAPGPRSSSGTGSEGGPAPGERAAAGPPGEGGPEGTVGWPATAAMVVLAVPCVLVGVAPGGFGAWLPPGAATGSAYTTTKVLEGLAIAGLGGLGFVLVRRPLGRLGHVPDLEVLYHPGGAALWTVGTRGTAALGRFARAVAAAGRTVLAPVEDPTVGPGRTDVGRAVLLVTLTAVVLLTLLFV